MSLRAPMLVVALSSLAVGCADEPELPAAGLRPAGDGGGRALPSAPSISGGSTGGSGGKVTDAGLRDANTDADTDACVRASVTPEFEIIPGNLLVLFDRSVSMAAPFAGSSSRLQAATDALLAGLTPLLCSGSPCSSALSVAAVMFPAHPAGEEPGNLSCRVDGLGSSEQLGWRPAEDFVKDFPAYWETRDQIDVQPFSDELFPLLWGTPIGRGFEVADGALDVRPQTGRTAVLFMTDGEATCDDGVDPKLQAALWTTDGIETHVVSLAGDGLGAVFNDDVAEAGGNARALNPRDADALQERLQAVVQRAAQVTSCDVGLSGARLSDPIVACETGKVTLGGKALNCDSQQRSEGYYLRDAATLVLLGDACTRLKDGEVLKASFPCEDFDTLPGSLTGR